MQDRAWRQFDPWLLLCALALESRLRLGLWDPEGTHGGMNAAVAWLAVSR